MLQAALTSRPFQLANEGLARSLLASRTARDARPGRTRNVLLTTGVSRADEVLAASFIEFEIVGYFSAVKMVTNDESIRWVLKPKVFHEVPV
jgi:hypothetical protein